MLLVVVPLIVVVLLGWPLCRLRRVGSNGVRAQRAFSAAISKAVVRRSVHGSIVSTMPALVVMCDKVCRARLLLMQRCIICSALAQGSA